MPLRPLGHRSSFGSASALPVSFKVGGATSHRLSRRATFKKMRFWTQNAVGSPDSKSDSRPQPKIAVFPQLRFSSSTQNLDLPCRPEIRLMSSTENRRLLCRPEIRFSSSTQNRRLLSAPKSEIRRQPKIAVVLIVFSHRLEIRLPSQSCSSPQMASSPAPEIQLLPEIRNSPSTQNRGRLTSPKIRISSSTQNRRRLTSPKIRNSSSTQNRRRLTSPEI